MLFCFFLKRKKSYRKNICNNEKIFLFKCQCLCWSNVAVTVFSCFYPVYYKEIYVELHKKKNYISFYALLIRVKDDEKSLWNFQTHINFFFNFSVSVSVPEHIFNFESIIIIMIFEFKSTKIITFNLKRWFLILN